MTGEADDFRTVVADELPPLTCTDVDGNMSGVLRTEANALL
jgi:hypothetical protein